MGQRSSRAVSIASCDHQVKATRMPWHVVIVSAIAGTKGPPSSALLQEMVHGEGWVGGVEISGR
jgi:hypothetical protein